MNPRLTASLLIAAAVLANVAFAALGSIFNYPDVLDEPAADVLASFRAHEGAVSFWFSVLALSAALLAPIAIGVRRLSSHPAMRIAVWVGSRGRGRAGDRPAPLADPRARLRRRRRHRRVPDGGRHPRHGDRRDARLRAHRCLDGARHRRARPRLRGPLVRDPRRHGGSARRRRRRLAARPARRRRGELPRLRALQRLARSPSASSCSPTSAGARSGAPARARRRSEHNDPLDRGPRARVRRASEADGRRVGRGGARVVRRDRGAARERAHDRRRRDEQPRVEAGGGADPAELPAAADAERDRGRALGSLHGRRPGVPGEGAERSASAAQRSASSPTCGATTRRATSRWCRRTATRRWCRS